MDAIPTEPDPHAAAVRALMAGPAYRTLLDAMRDDHDRTVADIVALTEIAAPPFGEAARGAAFRRMLEAHGLDGIETDAVGNVLGLWRGTGGGGLVAVAAHLDTVFPAGTDVRVRRDGTVLRAPGVGDDTRSLAVLLAWLRAMRAAAIRTEHDILFVADVGEEGNGDLRGMRHLFTAGPYRGRIGAFITVDSPDMDCVAVRGIGAKRYRVQFRGPGGHSWGAFGTVSPFFAMAEAIAALGRTAVPAEPRTTFSVGIVSGGTSINAIPDAATMEVDLRSEGTAELAALEARFLGILDEAVAHENRARSTAHGAIGVEATRIGDRPAGETPLDQPLVRIAAAALGAHGFAPRFVSSSTDANIAMSLGIPAIKIGSGGTGGRAHSPEEWIDVAPGPSLRGMAAGLTTLLALAGAAPG